MVVKLARELCTSLNLPAATPDDVFGDHTLQAFAGPSECGARSSLASRATPRPSIQFRMSGQEKSRLRIMSIVAGAILPRVTFLV